MPAKRRDNDRDATLENNAFYAEPASYPSAIVVTYDDGTSQSVSTGPQQAPPAPGS